MNNRSKVKQKRKVPDYIFFPTQTLAKYHSVGVSGGLLCCLYLVYLDGGAGGEETHYAGRCEALVQIVFT